MACGSCGTLKASKPNGCKSNGSCTTGGCEKLSVFNWLSNMTLPSTESPFDIFEVRFKNGRKRFYKNSEKLSIAMGDVVAVESTPGHDIGTVSLIGELVKVQMKKRNVSLNSREIKRIYRKASQRDLQVWEKARNREQETQRKGREILGRLGLKMKLSDVEFQGDGNKATFYYTADARVDFRQLIKDLAATFSIRVEMKQVGSRQEASRLGGIGPRGRELCCSTWLTDFRKVTTSAARYQQLSLNPSKLAGQCGKLKCCLNFELDTYLDALNNFPKQEKTLKTEKGEAELVKMDIFKKFLWYTYTQDRTKWIKLSLDQVHQVIDLNKKDQVSCPLEDYESDCEEIATIAFENGIGSESLNRFDLPRKKRRNKNNRREKTSIDTNQSQAKKKHKPKKPVQLRKNKRARPSNLEESQNQKKGPFKRRKSNTK